MNDIEKIINNTKVDKKLQILIETSTLTAFFRSLVKYPFSHEIIEFLKEKGDINDNELNKTWDGFDNIFGREYGTNISALSFSAIIEARGLLIDKLLIEKSDNNSVILEIASGFSPRAINLIENHEFNSSQYIETDRDLTIDLKKYFYKTLGGKKPTLSSFNVVEDNIFLLKEKILELQKINPNINKLFIVFEGLLIYLSPIEQKKFFEKISLLNKSLLSNNIVVECLSIDLPSHENFTNWMLNYNFSHNEHIDVMNKVEPKIIKSLHNTELDFFDNIGIQRDNIKKYYYTDDIISTLQTGKLDKYIIIPDIKYKISNFLKQDILFAYIIKF